MSRLLHPLAALCGSTWRNISLPSVVTVLVALGLTAPQYAVAEAVPGPASIPGPSGLPDRRVYEQVSPPLKPGSQAGDPVQGTAPYMAAGNDGNEVAYYGTGPLGETATGYAFFNIARRFPGGWQSRDAVSRGQGLQGLFRTSPETGLGFSADMTASVFGMRHGVAVPEQTKESPTPHLYRYSEDGLLQWIGEPTISSPVRFAGFVPPDTGEIAGTSPDLNTIYYAFEGALVAEDEEPNPTLGNISYSGELRLLNEKFEKNEAAGSSVDNIYEWDKGVLKAAAVLPNGHLDPFGAVPADTLSSTEYSAENLGNQVSEDGRDLFFWSPDPRANSGRPSELYVRKTEPDGSQTTSLVSRDLLLPETAGEPAPSPSGLAQGGGGGRFYASPDGSHAFFESPDQLTASAPSAKTVKEYEFDTRTDTLTYLPGVGDLSYECSGECGLPFISMLGAARDGSNFMFAKVNKLELWSKGQVSEIATIENGINPQNVIRATPDGSVYVFTMKSAFPGFGFNNGNGEYQEIYRYESPNNKLSCISCPPVGVSPSGDAELSHAFPSGALGNTFLIVTGNHGISSNAARISFDTPDPMVSQDTNGVRDAYVWENGTVRLISTGVSRSDSFAGDTSPSGDDLFFSTSENIAPGDTDEGYDVYDARVPRPGDQLPPSAVPCDGSVCQGPPGIPQLFSSPASESFSGAGDVKQSPVGKPTGKGLTRKQKLARALTACRHKKNRHRRAVCEQRAHRAYGAAASKSMSSDGKGHQSGRGK